MSLSISRALKYSNLEDFRFLKSSNLAIGLEDFGSLKSSNLATSAAWVSSVLHFYMCVKNLRMGIRISVANQIFFFLPPCTITKKKQPVGVWRHFCLCRRRTFFTVQSSSKFFPVQNTIWKPYLWIIEKVIELGGLIFKFCLSHHFELKNQYIHRKHIQKCKRQCKYWS